MRKRVVQVPSERFELEKGNFDTKEEEEDEDEEEEEEEEEGRGGVHYEKTTSDCSIQFEVKTKQTSSG